MTSTSWVAPDWRRKQTTPPRCGIRHVPFLPNALVFIDVAAVPLPYSNRRNMPSRTSANASMFKRRFMRGSNSGVPRGPRILLVRASPPFGKAGNHARPFQRSQLNSSPKLEHPRDPPFFGGRRESARMLLCHIWVTRHVSPSPSSRP